MKHLSPLLSSFALGLAVALCAVPAEAAPFVDRQSLRPGMIVRPGPVTAILDELGWEWGGDWVHVADLHHIVWRAAPFGAAAPRR